MRSLLLTLATGAASLAAAVPALADGGHGPHRSGAVYAITNDPAGNAVATFDRAADGSLTTGPT